MMDKPEASTEATLNDALQLLQEVSAYLKRLPFVPVTAQLVRKIDAHLESPETATVRRLASEHERSTGTRRATIFSPAGWPLVELDVYADSVNIQVTSSEYYRNAAISRLLIEGGVELPLLKPMNSPTAKPKL